MYMNDGNKTKINLRNKSVFITGVAGFIGSNLAKRLLSTVEGVKVVGLDNMNHYYDVRLKEARLNELEQFDNFSFVKGNLADKAVIESIFEQYKPEIVVNLGAQAGVRYSITNPDAYVEANLIGFYNILEACRHSYDEGHTPVEHLVYASSSSVYGSNKKVPYSTDDKVDNPVSLYAATKKSNELMAHTALFWKPNLVHVHSSFGGSFYRKALIIEIASLSKIPVVNHVHGADFDEFYRKKSQKKKKTIEKIYNKCIRTIALSEEWKKNLAEIVPEQTIRVVENYGILQEDLIKEKLTKPNNKLILFLGFICERKGCFDIPAIVDQVCSKIPDARFILGGSGEIEKVKQKLSAKYKDNVEFPGWIRNEQKRQYLREADIFLLPSYNEGMPMAILDAMGCGLPIVSTDVGGIPKIVRQGINGYLYKPGDSKSMACAIIEYLTDDEKRLKAGQESVDIIRESYSLQQNIDKLERVYTEVERLRDDKL